jgi:hypothetical protein
MDQQRFIAVISGLAALGQGGLEYNEPSSASPFKSLPGVWSNLALACLIHMGMKRLTLDEDSGLLIRADFASEHCQKPLRMDSRFHWRGLGGDAISICTSFCSQ